jgi:nitroimidazol reductase NimA-like FMN-containing flavoprotein (pyridoxamine 5'-phosphate oxidase superfamily)
VPLAPRLRALVEVDSFATLSVTRLGRIRTYVMWVGAEGDDLIIVTDAASTKLRALRLDPSVTVVVWDRQEPTDYVEVLGTAVAIEVSERARRLLEVDLATRYNGRPYPRPDVDRWAKVTIRPSRQRVW